MAAAEPARVTLPIELTAAEMRRVRAATRGSKTPAAWAKALLLDVAGDLDDPAPSEPTAVSGLEPEAEPETAGEPEALMPVPALGDTATVLEELRKLDRKVDEMQTWLHVVYAEIRTQAVLVTATAKLGPMRRLITRLRGRTMVEAAERERWAVGIGGQQLGSMQRLIENGPPA
jgi:hypothetical protein